MTRAKHDRRRRKGHHAAANERPRPNDLATQCEAALAGRTETVWLIALLVTMAALRVLYLIEFEGKVSSSADTRFFVEYARRIADGDIFLSGQTLVFSPFYSYFLALVFAVTGVHYLPVVILQYCVGIGGAWLTWRLARELFGPLAALLTLGLTALYGMALVYEGQLLDASFSMAFPPAFLLLLERASTAKGGGRPWQWLAGGALLGLFGWTRPNALLVAPFAAIWAHFRAPAAGGATTRQRDAKPALLLLAGVAAAVLPVTVRNWAVTGTPTILTTHGGINFFIGNNPHASGFLSPPPGMAAIPGPMNQAIPKQAAEAATGRTGMTDAEVSDYWFGQGMKFIRTDPGAATTLMLRKARAFLNGAEVESNLDVDLLKEISTAVRVAFVPIGLVLPLGLAGMLLSLRQWRRHLLYYLYFAVSAVSVILFFVTARYRLPVVPVLLVYSGFALRQLVASLNELARLAGVTALVIVLAFMTNGDLGLRVDKAVVAHAQGVTLEGLGRTEEAVARYERALSLNPTLLFTHLQLARIFKSEGKLDAAAQHYEAALQLAPGDAAVQAEVSEFREDRAHKVPIAPGSILLYPHS